MTPEQQQIAIAEACGWDLFCSHKVDTRTVQYGHPPNSARKYETPLPDYLNDLNAMHEAEKVLTEKQIRSYAFTLAQVLDTTPTVDLDDQFLNSHAPAQKRAEAFLRTLGKWEEAK